MKLLEDVTGIYQIMCRGSDSFLLACSLLALIFLLNASVRPKGKRKCPMHRFKR
jgi:hypothetical protein